MFVGQGRSGHSILGDLIDAHPNALCAQEYNLCKYFILHQERHEERRRAFLNEVQRNSNPSRTKYVVKGQWQNQYKELYALGACAAGKTSEQLRGSIDLLKKINAFTNLPIKLIHVVRNPFDMITTKILKRPNKDLPLWIHIFHERARWVAQIEQELQEDTTNNISLLRLRQEDFINNTEGTLKKACDYLELSSDKDYLNACSDIVFKKPRQTRYKIEEQWTSELKDKLLEGIKEYDYLSHYTFDE